MQIKRSIQILALVMLVVGCTKENDYLEDGNLETKSTEELPSTKASVCISALIFNTTPVTKLPFEAYKNAFVFDGKMYATINRIEGRYNPYTDWWQSSDGFNWNNVEMPRSLSYGRFMLVAFKNYLWCIEQTAYYSARRRVWRLPSSYGLEKRTWQLVSSISNHPNISLIEPESSYVVFKDKIWHFSGEFTGVGGNTLIRSSNDMVNWTTTVRDFRDTPELRYSSTYTVFGGKIWMIGGYSNDFYGYSGYTGDEGYSWYSNDGLNWTKATSGRQWNLEDHATVVYDKKLWVIGGRNPSYIENPRCDIWVSNDGLSWSEVTRYRAPPFSPRMGHSVVTFENKLWVIGGRDNNGGRSRAAYEVWNMQKCSNKTIVPSLFD